MYIIRFDLSTVRKNYFAVADDGIGKSWAISVTNMFSMINVKKTFARYGRVERFQ